MMTPATRAAARCGATPYHPTKGCRACRAAYMRDLRAKRHNPRPYGFRGPECLECGGTRSRVEESGYSDDDQRIRRRVCLDCGQECASVEVYVDPEKTTFWKLNGNRSRKKRETDYRKRGKGIYRLTNRRSRPDRLRVTVTVLRGGPQPVTECVHGHALTEDNVYRGPKGEYRECLTCRQARWSQRTQERRERVA